MTYLRGGVGHRRVHNGVGGATLAKQLFEPVMYDRAPTFPRKNRRRKQFACSLRQCWRLRNTVIMRDSAARKSSGGAASNTKPLPLPFFGSKSTIGIAQSAGRAS